MNTGIRCSDSSKSSSQGIVHPLKFFIIKVLVIFLVVVFLILPSLALLAPILSLAYLMTCIRIPALSEREGRSREMNATENALGCFNG
jgi:hypothetical protein